MKPQMLSPGLCLVPVQPQGHQVLAWGSTLQLHPWCWSKSTAPTGEDVQMSQASLEHLVLQRNGQGGQSLKLLREEAQGAAPSRAEQGIWRSMILSAENRREKQSALVKLAGTFGGKSVILEQLTIKEHSPATIFHPNYFPDPPLRHVRCMLINKVNTQFPSLSHRHCSFWTDPQAGKWEALQQLLKSPR